MNGAEQNFRSRKIVLPCSQTIDGYFHLIFALYSRTIPNHSYPEGKGAEL